jgi:hypothetical protein
VSDVFGRNSYNARRTEVRTIVAGVGILVVASIGWFFVRDGLTVWLAQSNVGCRGREKLILAAIRQHDPTVPTDAEAFSYVLPPPGWVGWRSVYEVRHLSDSSTLYKSKLTLADGKFRIKGVVRDNVKYWAQPPIGLAGDGKWAILAEVHPTDLDVKKNDLTYFAVLRLCDGFNEVVWLGLLDDAKGRAAGARVKPVWREGNEKGTKELAFITVVATRGPQGGIVFKTPENVAVFKLDSEHGLLASKLLPDDCGIVAWRPPNNAPVRVDQLAELEPLFRKLLPIP